MKTQFLLLIGLLFIQSVPRAQIQLTNLPSTTANTRFFEEIHSNMKRPGLSIIGFDNGGDNQYGYGLKQVIENIYFGNDSTLFVDDILRVAKSTINETPNSGYQAEINGNILQYAAFEALVALVLEQNGITAEISNNQYGIPIRSFNEAYAHFKNGILELSLQEYNILGQIINPASLIYDEGDFVKMVRQYDNLARALDLYLAIENAFQHYNLSEYENQNSTILLSQSEKVMVFDRFAYEVHEFFDKKVDKVYAPGLHERELEPGNRPLKGVLTSAYSSLATQTTTWGNEVDWLLDQGFHSASGSTSQNRTKHWAYQSSNGQRQWAEGPYYLHFALTSAIPFWHAVRANDLLGSVEDPFKHRSGTTSADWFLNPVEWLADISTPEGFTPMMF